MATPRWFKSAIPARYPVPREADRTSAAAFLPDAPERIGVPSP